MSKIKDAVQRSEEVRQHYYWSFMESLYEMMPKQPELTELDIQDMEREHSCSLPQSNISIPKEVLNNQYYEPNEDGYYAS